MKVAVLGSGNGGSAVAFEWSKAGHDVSMFDFEEFDKNISAIKSAGGITSEGELEGFQKLTYVGHDISKVVPDADIIFVVGPAYSTEPFGKACKPYIKPGQMYIICPSSCAGSLVFKKALGLEIEDESVIIAETSTLPYAVRIIGDAKIAVYNRLKGAYFIAALPSKFNQKVYDVVGNIYTEIEIAENVLQTTLQNANPIIHPAVTLLNAALIERTQGDFLFYEEGVTQAVGRIIKAMDDERIEIGNKIGVTVIPDPVLGIKQGYMADDTYDIGYSKAPGFKGIMAQTQLDYRYFNEDAGFGLVFFTDLAKQFNVKTPTMDAVIKLASIVMARDYKEEKARTMESLGLSKYSLEELKKII
ncbi:NAD/NADP octopine/nopaline dehydrogenase family protein [Sedimentibacter sp. MB31-C6]|uniref:NAD/NADP octopine/nopaline dehydrogenase family protein n=1 Tax=Sedimentibacter sp. MB31-C6 TaxID=3109366 RepID=UPI002DDD860F|nr:NAD/NADP octopine/nopaline dehydrogenase family protein [Sedimentibacter sp. MB36-C1]WSI02877.1 NAD/NADP octopine/nopaline dehydrogenase family protein [Sedimentibacter sp. MB36-C1]